ncbi:NUDIX domain-containing protein [Sphaerisporangium sp. NPDC051017]|uniref:NUDIX domain-containing protein n=1 Tax=Sphaerisporangium sp. NPDC051017 TaxID=3154636 RepID=UPI0034375C4D
MPISEYLAGLRSQVGTALLLLPSVNAFIFDEQGRLLLGRHSEQDDVWSAPGGTVEPDEAPLDAAVRETREEVGLDVTVRGLIGAYGGPRFRTTYPNGDQVAHVITIYGCTAEGGTAVPDGVEISEIRWVTEAEAATLASPSWLPVVLPDCFAWWRASRETWTPVA